MSKYFIFPSFVELFLVVLSFLSHLPLKTEADGCVCCSGPCCCRPCCSCCLCHKGPICIRLPCTCPCCCKCCGCCCCSPQSCLSCCGRRRKRNSHKIRDFLPKSCYQKNNNENASRGLLLTKTIFY
ncbi:hypothetical protein ACQ4LE_010634 [Meloidogyne hapla]